jgi:hypothetical protein
MLVAGKVRKLEVEKKDREVLGQKKALKKETYQRRFACYYLLI